MIKTKANKTISIETELLTKIEKLIQDGQVLGMSKFFEIAVSNELEKYEIESKAL